MLGLVNRSIQNFLTDTFGERIWYAVACKAGVSPEGFEPMLSYEDALTDRLLNVACETLDRRRFDFLEDLGTYLSTREAVRRLLRYGGRGYVDFLRSLNELHGRTQLALEDLKLPELTLRGLGQGQYSLSVLGASPGWGAVFAGVLRAMADDYGALVLIELNEHPEDGLAGEAITVQLLDSFHGSGRSFDLSDAAGVEM